MTNIIISTSLIFLATQGVLISTEKLSPQESFFLRRMTEFWKDRDYTLVKKQIEEFLAANPESSIHDNLHAILADIVYQEKEYQKALELYEKIVDANLQKKSTTRQCQCLYLLGHYDRVIATVAPLLSDDNPVDSKIELQFLLADSLYRKLHACDDPDQRKTLATEAKPLLLKLYDTSPYKEKVLLPLAEVHRLLDENPQAASLYAILAEKMPDKKEEILVQVAVLQMTLDKNAAIETF